MMMTSNWKRITLGGLVAVGLSLTALAARPAAADPCAGCTVPPPGTITNPGAIRQPPSTPPLVLQLPDLVARADWMEAEWLAPGQFRARFGWHNPTGVDFAKPVTIQVFVDGVVRATKTAKPLQAGWSSAWYADFPLDVGPGVHSLCMVVNPPSGVIDEVTHSNNTACILFLGQNSPPR